MDKSQKILVIGASGMVGMAAVDALHGYVGADIITYAQPVTDQNQNEMRTHRKAIYETMKAQGDALLDTQQAKWILSGVEPVFEDFRGTVTQTANLEDALSETLGCIVIASDTLRSGRREANAKYNSMIAPHTLRFAAYGEAIADSFAAKLKDGQTPRFPVVINTGNPVDSMTELLVEVISQRLDRHLRQAWADHDKGLAQTLAETIRDIPKRIVGQSCVSDGAHAAFAIHREMNIPLHDILGAPVIGPHNTNMVVDFDGIRVRRGGEAAVLPLTDDQKTQIERQTRGGAGDVAADIMAKLGIPHQAAVFAPAAGVAKMAAAVMQNEKPVTLCASVYDPKLERAMGREITLGENGAELMEPVLAPALRERLAGGMKALANAYDAVTNIRNANVRA